MAGGVFFGLVDIQALYETLGLSDAHVPTKAEIKRIKDQYFGAPPLDTSKQKDFTWTDPGNGRDYGAYTEDIQFVRQQGAGVAAGSIFFPRADYGATADVGAISFDLILSEEQVIENTICSHPVQNGSVLTDHIQPKLPHGSLKVLVSNYSLKYAPGGTKAREWDASTNRALLAYQMFKAISTNRQTVTLVTALEPVLLDVAFPRVTAPLDSESGDSITFSVDFQQIKIAQARVAQINSYTNVKDMTRANSRKAAAKKSSGKITPTAVTPAPAASTGPLGNAPDWVRAANTGIQ